MWTDCREVSELFWINFGERRCSHGFNKMFNSGAGRIGSIIPTGEGSDDVGATQLWSTDPTDVF
jgi:hypothetical protein